MSEEPAAPEERVGEEKQEVKPVNETIQQDQVRDKETELMMLEDEPIEDEKMPSYMNATSISSISISTKHEDSRNDNDEVTQPQLDPLDPLRNDDDDDDDEGKNQGSGNDNSSVVELSSGEDSDRGDEEVEDEEDYSTDEMGYDEDEEEFLRRRGEYPEDDDDEESDGDIEADQFERSSDEYIYRSAPLESPIKERSRSLQDLSSPNRRSGKFSSRRQFQVMPVHMEMDGKPTDFHLGGQRRAAFAPNKYGNVTSKVKQYIEGIKEQNRMSAQRRSRDRLDVNRELSNLIKRDQNMETDIRVNPQSRLLKTYAENNIKLMINDNSPTVEDMTVNRNVPENGAEIIAVTPGDSMKKSYEAMAMEVDKENEIHEDQVNRQCEIKQNGLSINTQSDSETKHEIKERDKEEIHCELTNGNNEMPHVSSFQSVSYEDFVKGHFKDNQKTETSKPKSEKNAPENHQQDPDKQRDISVVPKPLKIQNVESLSEEIIVTGKKGINPEVSILKAQLNQTMAERDGMKEDYKMIVNENFQLKREIEELKKALANHQQEHKPKETKVVAVQTEVLPSVFDKSAVSHLKVPNKLSASSITSAQSSEHWTDSNCSPSVSLKPPNVGSILNSDDSIYLGSPNRKTSRPLSQAFYTSSRILQTLANITQGKSDPANPNNGVKRMSTKGRMNEPLSPLVLGDINTRKRKASDSNETSSVGNHQFKIPNLNNHDKRRKYNSNYETDGDKTTLGQSLTSRDRSINNDGSKLMDDFTETEEIKIDDGIKCFVYKEDDDSKEKSFLLQAEDTHKVDTNGIVRECGPFLLANLEVRMSEANGTINIWGKEVNRDSTSEDIDEELEEDPPESNEYWPKTPRVEIKRNEFVCSTEKRFKPIVSNAARAKITRQLNPLLHRPGGPLDEHVDRQFGSMPNLDNHGVNTCGGCSHKQIHSPVQKHIKIKNHSCCHSHEIDDCDCETVQQTCGHGSGCCGVSVSNPSNLHVRHTCTNHLQNEEICRHQAQTHLLPEPGDGCCYRRKRCRSVELPCKSGIENTCTRGRIQSVDSNSLFAGDNVPLIQSERSSEIGDNAKRRLSGKRVRGILRDFLKSCGDSCRHPQDKSTDATLTERHINAAPDIRVTTVPAPEPETSNCDKCGKHVAMADFQQQFEQLQADLEKIHSKSQALFKMMTTLRHLD